MLRSEQIQRAASLSLWGKSKKCCTNLRTNRFSVIYPIKELYALQAKPAQSNFSDMDFFEEKISK